MAGEFITVDTGVFLGLNDFQAITKINTEAKCIETFPPPEKKQKHLKIVKQEPIKRAPMTVIKDEIGWGWMYFDEHE
jgi:streptogramin lyase